MLPRDPRCRGRALAGLALALMVSCSQTPPADAGGVADSRPTVAAIPESLTISDCMQRAREMAPGVLAAGEDASAAAYDSQATSCNSRPVFKAFGGATLAPKGFYDPVITNLGQYQLKAGIELPLLDGGGRARSRLRVSNASGLAALALEQARRDAGQRAAELAVEVIRLMDRQAVEAEGLDWLDRLSRLLHSGVAGGSHGAGDVLRTQLERDGLEASLGMLRTDLASTRRELAQLLAIGSNAEWGVRAPAPFEDRVPGKSDSLRAIGAAENSPEVRAAKLSEAQLELDLREAQSRNRINISLSADAGLAGADLTSVVPGDLKASDAGAGVLDRLRRDLGASVTLDFARTLSDPTVRPAITAREKNLRGAGMRTRTELANQRRALLDLLDRWRAASLRSASLRAIVERSGENLLRSKSLYVTGAVSLFELLDARRLEQDARERLADALAEERKSHFQLEVRR